jgi:hypothetical protein
MKLYPVTIDGETKHYLTAEHAAANEPDDGTFATDPIDSDDHDDFDPHHAALALHFGVALEEIDESCDGDSLECDSEPGRYLVCDDGEADERFEQHIDEQIDETVLPEIPEAYREYFDREQYTSDQVDNINAGGGRGAALASYDSQEHEVKIDGEFYFIYRVS